MKKVWVFHHYASLPTLNGHIRPYCFGRELKTKGIDTTVFASSYQHFSDYHIITGNKKYIVVEDFEIPYVFIKTPSSKKSGVSRLFNMLVFSTRSISVARKISKASGRPDVIIASSPQPFSLLSGIWTAKRLGIPCICEIRDLWPEAIFYISRKIRETSFIGRVLKCGERWIYRHANALIFTKEGDTDYIKEQKWDLGHGGNLDLSKCFYINNGVDLDEYQIATRNHTLKDEDLDADKFNILYCGAIRPLNNVERILDCAELLRDEEDLQFIIYGEGSLLSELKERARREELKNVKFKGFVEKKYIPYILSRSSLNLLNYSAEKYNWARGNSSNKLFEYMASGKPILSTVKMGYSLLEKYDCGISTPKDSPQEMAKAILEFKSMSPERYAQMSHNALMAARDFDYRTLTEKLVRVLDYVSKP